MEIEAITHLPNDILFGEIFSSIDTIEVVRTCVLSKAWRDRWDKIDILNFDRSSFLHKSRSVFHNFVYHVLKHRHNSNLPRLRFFTKRERDFYGKKSSIFNEIVFDYSILHHVNEIETDVTQFPQSLRDCKSLKTLHINYGGSIKTPLNFKYLTTLFLSEIDILVSRSNDLVSNCENLQNLHIINCDVDLERNQKSNTVTFVVNAPRLINLTIRQLVKKYGRYVQPLDKLRITSKSLKNLKIDWIQVYMPEKIDILECKAMEEVEVHTCLPISPTYDRHWKTNHIDFMKLMADDWFFNAENLNILFEFYWGKFILTRESLSRDIRFEEKYVDVKLDCPNWDY